MPHILAMYFIGYLFLGIYLAMPSDGLAVITIVALSSAALAHGIHMVLSVQQQRRTKQLQMFSHQVMPYIHLTHPTCNYHNLNK